MLTSCRENIYYLRLSQLCSIMKSRYVSNNAIEAVDSVLIVVTSYPDLRL